MDRPQLNGSRRSRVHQITTHARYFPIIVIHIKVFKKPLDLIVTIDTLPKVNCSEWAASSFIIPKKDGQVRFISDFR